MSRRNQSVENSSQHFTAEDYAQYSHNRGIARGLFVATGIAGVFGFFLLQGGNIFEGVLAFAGTLGLGTAGLYFIINNNISTNPGNYHRLQLRLLNWVIGFYGNEQGGWHQLPFWQKIEEKPFYRLERIVLSDKDFLEVDTANNLPITLRGRIVFTAYPDKAPQEYQKRLMWKSTPLEVREEIRDTALHTIMKIVLEALDTVQQDLQKNPEQTLEIASIQKLISDKFKTNVAGIVIYDETFIQQTFGAAVEKEIVKAMAARMGFETLMEGNFSLEQFGKARASLNNAQLRIYDHHTERATQTKPTQSQATQQKAKTQEVAQVTPTDEQTGTNIQPELSDEEKTLEERRRRLQQ